MDFTLKINCDNAAFEGEQRNLEVARILREAAERLERGSDHMQLRDINGNTVGDAVFCGD